MLISWAMEVCSNLSSLGLAVFTFACWKNPPMQGWTRFLLWLRSCIRRKSARSFGLESRVHHRPGKACVDDFLRELHVLPVGRGLRNGIRTARRTWSQLASLSGLRRRLLHFPFLPRRERGRTAYSESRAVFGGLSRKGAVADVRFRSPMYASQPRLFNRRLAVFFFFFPT